MLLQARELGVPKVVQARMLLNVARRAWLRTKRVPVTFYDDREIARLAESIGGRVVRTEKIGAAPILVDGMARIDLAKPSY